MPKALVQVVDNGLGMSVTDARLSLNVMLHQNRKAEDLFSAYQFPWGSIGFNRCDCPCGNEDQTRSRRIGNPNC
jgi:hypothetical protein